jgi:DNA-binding NarL/FixJ family response regulator
MAEEMTDGAHLDARFPLSEPAWNKLADELALSPQQSRIVRLVLSGWPDKAIAKELGLSLATVRTYLARIFLRLGVADRVELILFVFRLSVQRGDCPHCR